MSGQIIERGERRWLIRWYEGRDESSGKRRYRSETIHGNKKDAEAVLRKKLGDRDAGIVRQASRMTLNSYADHGLVFANDLGLPLDERNLVRRHFKRAIREAGLPKALRLYDLRHSFASLAMAAGAHVKVVSKRLGHSSTKMTLDVYSHALAPVERDADAKIEAALFGRD